MAGGAIALGALSFGLSAFQNVFNAREKRKDIDRQLAILDIKSAERTEQFIDNIQLRAASVNASVGRVVAAATAGGASGASVQNLAQSIRLRAAIEEKHELRALNTERAHEVVQRQAFEEEKRRAVVNAFFNVASSAFSFTSTTVQSGQAIRATRVGESALPKNSLPLYAESDAPVMTGQLYQGID